MKKLALALTVFSCVALAQVSNNKVSTKAPNESVSTTGKTAEGIRVGIFKANYEAVLKFSGRQDSASFADQFSVDMDTSNGFSVGYVSIPVRALGFAVNANYIEHILNSRSANTVRYDGNATYAFNRNLFSKVGLNYTQMVSAGARHVKGDVGYQLGLGYQISSLVGLDLTMSESRFSFDQTRGVDQASVDYIFRGLEMGLTGTF